MFKKDLIGGINKWKKILIFIILCLFLFSLFACNKPIENEPKELDNETKLSDEVIKNYKKYDKTYDEDSFNIRKIDSLKGRDDFIYGADISLYSAILEAGSYYYNKDNKEESICKILKDNGINTIRFRLFNDYTSPTGTKKGKLDLPRVISMIKEAKKYELDVLLDFHYSDTWSDPGHQIIPYAWKDYSYQEVLVAFYNYTKDVLLAIKNENLSVEYVQIGNEIDYAIVSPHGLIDWDNQEESFDRMAEILSKGSKATREVFPNAKIIIHTASGLYRWVYENEWVDAAMHFYKALEKRKLDYDIIGASFYTFQDENTPISYISDIIDNYKNEINKPVLMVETSYAFTYEWNDYTHNIFYTDKELPDYPVSFQGQTNLMLDLIDEIASAKDNNGIGICYWGGDMIPNKDPDIVTSWGNQALFTYEGVETPTLSLFKKCRPN